MKNQFELHIICGKKPYTINPKIDVEESENEKWENGTTRNGNLIYVLKCGQPTFIKRTIFWISRYNYLEDWKPCRCDYSYNSYVLKKNYEITLMNQTNEMIFWNDSFKKIAITLIMNHRNDSMSKLSRKRLIVYFSAILNFSSSTFKFLLNTFQHHSLYSLCIIKSSEWLLDIQCFIQLRR